MYPKAACSADIRKDDPNRSCCTMKSRSADINIDAYVGQSTLQAEVPPSPAHSSGDEARLSLESGVRVQCTGVNDRSTSISAQCCLNPIAGLPSGTPKSGPQPVNQVGLHLIWMCTP